MLAVATDDLASVSLQMPEFSKKRASMETNEGGDLDTGGGVSSKVGTGRLPAVGEF